MAANDTLAWMLRASQTQTFGSFAIRLVNGHVQPLHPPIHFGDNFVEGYLVEGDAGTKSIVAASAIAMVTVNGRVKPKGF